MKVSGRLHASATLPPKKLYSVPARLEAGWAPEDENLCSDPWLVYVISGQVGVYS
jgi:hypothetical protein